MTDWVERSGFLQTENGARHYVVTEPTHRSSDGLGVLLCSGAWAGGNWNINGMFVSVARELASAGHRVVRFDWFGSGESPGHVDKYRLSEPFGDELVAMAELLSDSRSLVAVGICFGAHSMLAAAPRLNNVSAVCLVSLHIPGATRRFVAKARNITTGAAAKAALRPSIIKGWFDPTTRRLYLKWLRLRLTGLFKKERPGPKRESATGEAWLAGELLALLDRGAEVRMVFGDSDPNYELVRDGQVAEKTGGRVALYVEKGDLYGYPTIESQEAVQRQILETVRSSSVGS